jgi:selenocysteine-specific elongation factor
VELSERLAALVERRSRGIAAASLPQLLGVPSGRAMVVAKGSPAIRQVADTFVSAVSLEALGARCLGSLRRHHREHPLDRGMPLETLRRSLRASDDLVEAVLDDLTRTGRMRRQQGLAALAGFTPRVPGGDAAVDDIVHVLEEAGLTPPNVSELMRQTGRPDAGAILRLAAGTGRVEQVEPDRYYTRSALDRFVRALGETGTEAPIVPSELRQRLGITRKYLIPLLEWADLKGFTAWDGGARRLRAAPRA